MSSAAREHGPSRGAGALCVALALLAQAGCIRAGFGPEADGEKDAGGVSSPPWHTGLTGGVNYTCALHPSGELSCWGVNADGRLGDGTTTDRPEPVKVTGLADVIDVAAGREHTCALRRGGTVVCWGRNAYGQLGDGTTTSSSVPVPVAGLPAGAATDVGCGRYSTCVVLADKRVMCWGWNEMGELGDGTTTDRRTPGPVTGLDDALSVSCGQHHCCALREGGKAACWGANGGGQLGDGTFTDSPVPVPVSALGNAVEVSVQKGTSCARVGAGQVYCWGANEVGQVGIGSAGGRRPTPVAVSGVADGAQLGHRGWDFVCALRQQGQVMCWGVNDAGQLGDGTTTDRASPVLVQGISDATEIGTGHYHGCARRATGAIACWGMGGPRLGAGADVTTDQTEPVQSLFVP